jgi:hypothetical protein
MDPAGQQFPFTVPADLPHGEQIFAWTWNNREQEFFMNCAVVNITGGANSVGLPSTPKSTPKSLPKPSSVSSSSPTAQSSNISNAAGYPPGQEMSQLDDESTEWIDSDNNDTDTDDCDNNNDSDDTSDGPALDVSMKFKRSPGGRAQRYVQRSVNVAFLTRPSMLFAIAANGCNSPKTIAELKYPNPGPTLVEGDGDYPVELPSGNCA